MLRDSWHRWTEWIHHFRLILPIKYMEKYIFTFGLNSCFYSSSLFILSWWEHQNELREVGLNSDIKKFSDIFLMNQGNKKQRIRTWKSSKLNLHSSQSYYCNESRKFIAFRPWIIVIQLPCELTACCSEDRKSDTRQNQNTIQNKTSNYEFVKWSPESDGDGQVCKEKVFWKWHNFEQN